MGINCKCPCGCKAHFDEPDWGEIEFLKSFNIEYAQYICNGCFSGEKHPYD